MVNFPCTWGEGVGDDAQGHADAPGSGTGTNGAVGNSTPDAQTTLPDRERPHRIPAGAEVIGGATTMPTRTQRA